VFRLEDTNSPAWAASWENMRLKRSFFLSFFFWGNNNGSFSDTLRLKPFISILDRSCEDHCSCAEVDGEEQIENINVIHTFVTSYDLYIPKVNSNERVFSSSASA
jgi:hypothetical protein